MTHWELQGLLADFSDQCLDESTHQEVERHVGTCTECRQWLGVYRLLRQHPEALHPASADLADHAMGRPTDPQVGEHLESCQECWQLAADASTSLAQAGFSQVSAEATDTLVSTTPAHGRWRAAALALAAALLVVIFFGVWISISGDRETEGPGWAGPADALVLSGAVRSGGASDTLHLRPDQPYAAVALDLGSRLEELEGSVEVRLLRLPDDVVWRGAYDAEELRRTELGHGLLMLYWPRELLPEGAYRVKVTDVGEAELWQRSFAVRHLAVRDDG